MFTLTNKAFRPDMSKIDTHLGPLEFLPGYRAAWPHPGGGADDAMTDPLPLDGSVKAFTAGP